MVFLLVFGTKLLKLSVRPRGSDTKDWRYMKKKIQTTAASAYSITLKRKRTCYSKFRSKLLENKCVCKYFLEFNCGLNLGKL